jgi:hypothetical protein
MMRLAWSAGVIACSTLIFPASRVAEACSVPRPPLALKGIPADGETGVATNVRPVYDLFLAGLEDPAKDAHFELVSASGVAIAVAARATHTWHFELFPAAELEPQTTYTLNASWTYGFNTVSFTQSFTTGSGPVVAAPPPPVASLRHYRLHEPARSSCESPILTGTCVSVDAGTLVQANDVDEFGQEHGPTDDNGMLTGGYLHTGSFFHNNLSGIDQGTNFECVRLRSRGSDGSLSEPVTLCRDDGPLYEIAGHPTLGCSTEGLTREGAPVLANDPISAGGCSVAGDGAPSAHWFMLAAVAAACRRLTSRRRSRS